MADAFSWPAVLGTLVRGGDLSGDVAERAMQAIMTGDATPVQIAGFLMGLRAKGEAVGEIAGLVRTMRAFARRVEPDGRVVDTCGTGGDRAGTFNVSTVAALVAAGAGARVAKHGNRAASGRCGSADLLEAWGIEIDLPPAGVEACLAQVGIGFCFAPTFHPAMRHAVPARRELGVPTVFNFLGPLTNPAGARHQTIGVSDPVMAPKMAAVLAQLDTAHALVFHGADGLDELTTTGPSHVWEVRDGEVSEWTFDPAAYGIPRARLEDLRGGGVDDNRRIAEAILGGAPGPPRELVVLGAAAALRAADVADSWEAGLDAAREAIDSGAARRVLDRWVVASKEQAAAAGA